MAEAQANTESPLRTMVKQVIETHNGERTAIWFLVEEVERLQAQLAALQGLKPHIAHVSYEGHGTCPEI